MDAQAWERGPRVHAAPGMAQMTIPQRPRSASPEELPDIGGNPFQPARRMPNGSRGLVLPTSASATEYTGSGFPHMTMPNSAKLPDIPRKNAKNTPPAGLTIPETSRPPSQSQGRAQGSMSGSMLIGASGASPVVNSIGPTSMTFDCVSIPASSSPLSSPALSGPRKRASSISYGTAIKRTRESASDPHSAASRQGSTELNDTTLHGDAAVAETPQPGTTQELPSSSQKAKERSNGKAKAVAGSQSEVPKFSKPTSFEEFFNAGTADDEKQLIADAEADIAAANKIKRDRIVAKKAERLRSCPFCTLPWPSKPSSKLLSLAQPLLDKYHEGRKINKEDKRTMCLLQHEEAVVIPEGLAKGWLSQKKPEWSSLRIAFLRGGKDGAQSWIMKQMCDRVRDPGSSRWLQRLREIVERDGARALSSAAGLYINIHHEQTGYFGEQGAAKMLEWLRTAFLEQKIPKGNNPYPEADLRLDAPEKATQLYPLNSTSFISRCLVPELATCLIQYRDGVSFDEADEIRTQSSNYGTAVFPLHAEEDVGQFLDFDLENDPQSPAPTPPASSSRVSAPDTPNRRSSRRTPSVASSPVVAQKADGKSKGGQARRGRKSQKDVDTKEEGEGSRPKAKAAGSLNAGEDSDTLPPSSGTASFRPKARQFARVASTNSNFSSGIYSDTDEDTSLAPASQTAAPSRPAGQAATKKPIFDAGVDSDGEAETSRPSASQVPPLLLPSSRATSTKKKLSAGIYNSDSDGDDSRPSTSQISAPPPSQPPPSSQRPQARPAASKASKQGSKNAAKSKRAAFDLYQSSDDDSLPKINAPKSSGTVQSRRRKLDADAASRPAEQKKRARVAERDSSEEAPLPSFLSSQPTIGSSHDPIQLSSEDSIDTKLDARNAASLGGDDGTLAYARPPDVLTQSEFMRVTGEDSGIPHRSQKSSSRIGAVGPPEHAAVEEALWELHGTASHGNHEDAPDSSQSSSAQQAERIFTQKGTRQSDALPSRPHYSENQLIFSPSRMNLGLHPDEEHDFKAPLTQPDGRDPPGHPHASAAGGFPAENAPMQYNVQPGQASLPGPSAFQTQGYQQPVRGDSPVYKVGKWDPYGQQAMNAPYGNLNQMPGVSGRGQVYASPSGRYVEPSFVDNNVPWNSMHNVGPAMSASVAHAQQHDHQQPGHSTHHHVAAGREYGNLEHYPSAQVSSGSGSAMQTKPHHRGSGGSGSGSKSRSMDYDDHGSVLHSTESILCPPSRQTSGSILCPPSRQGGGPEHQWREQGRHDHHQQREQQQHFELGRDIVQPPSRQMQNAVGRQRDEPDGRFVPDGGSRNQLWPMRDGSSHGSNYYSNMSGDSDRR
ncbi:hypothetical protein V8E36_007397 [Tilletia maclaganii]